MLLGGRPVLAVLSILFAVICVMSTNVPGLDSRGDLDRRITSPQLQRRNITGLPPLPNLPTAQGSPQSLSTPPDPFVFDGPKGIYTLSHFRGEHLSLLWATTFLFKCYVDLFQGISVTNVKASDPYPGGRFYCAYDFPNPSTSFSAFLTLVKLPGISGWRMTYKDVADDLEALWFAALWFQYPVAGLPMLDVMVERFVTVAPGPLYYAAHGSLYWTISSNANASAL